GELADLLADFADDDGTIKRQRASRVLRELEAIEQSIRERGTVAFETIIKESSEWTTAKLAGVVGISAAGMERVNKHVVNYVIKRFGGDGLVWSDLVWGLSVEMGEELSTVLRSCIIKRERINAMTPQIRQVYDNETWKIRRLTRTESVTAHRAATTSNAQA